MYVLCTSTPRFFFQGSTCRTQNSVMAESLLTIVEDNTSKDIVVSIFAKGYVKEGEGEVPTYGYVLEQSTEQKSVVSLEDMMGGKDSVTFDHCSMFVDVVGWGSPAIGIY